MFVLFVSYNLIKRLFAVKWKAALKKRCFVGQHYCITLLIMHLNRFFTFPSRLTSRSWPSSSSSSSSSSKARSFCKTKHYCIVKIFYTCLSTKKEQIKILVRQTLSPPFWLRDNSYNTWHFFILDPPHTCDIWWQCGPPSRCVAWHFLLNFTGYIFWSLIWKPSPARTS
jgi:hypothetical protein